MKIVGTKDRTEFELNPQKAWLRGMELDKLLRSSSLPHPRGVWRMTHQKMNEMDFERQLLQASKLNAAKL
jgi:Zn-finger nucleic acid-binding protein